MSDGQLLNTDRELWREPKVDGSPGDYYSPKIHVTLDGSIGIDVGGTVIVMPLRQWHSAAAALLAEREKSKRLATFIRSIRHAPNCKVTVGALPLDENCDCASGFIVRCARAALAEAGEEGK